MDPVWTVIGVVIGALAGWLVASFRAHGAQASLKNELMEATTELAAVNARTQERDASMERERGFFARQVKEMKAQFESLATTVLDKTKKGLLDATDERMKPLTRELEKLQRETRLMEEKRDKAYGSLGKELSSRRCARSGSTGGSTTSPRGRAISSSRRKSCTTES